MKSHRSTSGELINYRGLIVRAGTCDENVPGQLNQYKTLEVNGKGVLDLGAHIGGFTKYVHDRGAKYCYAVEPVPANIELWHMNVAGTESYLFEGMVLGKYELGGAAYCSNMRLYLSNGDTTGHTAYITKGREWIEAYAFTIEYLMNSIYKSGKRIDVVKIDIEGAEYGIMYDAAKLFPNYGIKQFAAELHLHRKGYREYAQKFVELFDEYYEQQVPVKLSGKLWNTTGVWRIR